MTWRATLIAAPKYIVEGEDGRILNDHHGQPFIVYSQKQADHLADETNNRQQMFGFPADAQPGLSD